MVPGVLELDMSGEAAAAGSSTSSNATPVARAA